MQLDVRITNVEEIWWSTSLAESPSFPSVADLVAGIFCFVEHHGPKGTGRWFESQWRNAEVRRIATSRLLISRKGFLLTRLSLSDPFATLLLGWCNHPPLEMRHILFDEGHGDDGDVRNYHFQPSRHMRDAIKSWNPDARFLCLWVSRAEFRDGFETTYEPGYPEDTEIRRLPRKS